MVLVPANMSSFGFSLYNFFLLFLVPTKYFTFEKSPWRQFSKVKYFAGTFLKIKRFCSDYFSNKWVQSSCVMCAKWSQKWGQRPKPKRDIFAETKNKKTKNTGTKTKTRHICRDQNHILAY